METNLHEKRAPSRFSLWSDGRTALRQPVTAGTYGELLDEFARADQLGFHGVWASEHHVPIYMGANTEKALERVARLADGFLAAANVDPAQTVTNQWNLLRSYLERYGRNAASFPLVVGMHLWVSEDPERDWATLLAPALAYQQGIYARMGFVTHPKCTKKLNHGGLLAGSAIARKGGST